MQQIKTNKQNKEIKIKCSYVPLNTKKIYLYDWFLDEAKGVG